ncbi:MAG: invasion associated locus B family protein [Methylocella sp.]
MRKTQIIAFGAYLLSCGAGLAQAHAPAAPAAPSAGAEGTSETFGDWFLHCGVSPTGSGEQACEVTTTIKLQGDAPVARIAFGRAIQPKGQAKGKEPAKDKPPMRLVVLVPVNVLIAPGVDIAPDAAKPHLTLPFKSCIPAACFAEMELDDDQMQTFRNHSQPGQLAFTDPAGSPKPLEISFKGLDQALDALAKR